MILSERQDKAVVLVMSGWRRGEDLASKQRMEEHYGEVVPWTRTSSCATSASFCLCMRRLCVCVCVPFWVSSLLSVLVLLSHFFASLCCTARLVAGNKPVTGPFGNGGLKESWLDFSCAHEHTPLRKKKGLRKGGETRNSEGVKEVKGMAG